MAAVLPWTQAAIAAAGVDLVWKKPPALSSNRYPEQFSCEQCELRELLRVEMLQPSQCPELPPAVSGGLQPSTAGHSSHPLTRLIPLGGAPFLLPGSNAEMPTSEPDSQLFVI